MTIKLDKKLCFIQLFLLASFFTYAQNYDEDKVPDYELPEILVGLNGEKAKKIEQWENTRRKEILELFKEHIYGYQPATRLQTVFQEVSYDSNTLYQRAIKKEVQVLFIGQKDTIDMNLLIFLPKQAEGAVPIFVGLNFYGNHTIHADPSISIQERWVKNKAEFDIFDNQASASSRGVRSYRWPVERIIERGYGLATIHYADMYPDYIEGADEGLPRLLQESNEKLGAIATWAHGLITAMDYFETDPAINHHRVAVMGHSRLGKTALWAGALDQRFALVISNDSGCGGAALSRRKFGETVERINDRYPYWFNEKFKTYNAAEDRLPVDQHMLLALMAPRPVYIASAKKDLHADPKGEFLSAFHASEAYRLYGLKAIETIDLPPTNEAIIKSYVGYHIRSGVHDVTRYDWERFMDFADFHFERPYSK